MSVSEWKKVNLYNISPCPQYKKVQNRADIGCVCYNGKQKVFCDNAGYVHVYYRNWDSISFRAVSSAIKHCALTAIESNLLVTLSRDEAKDDWLLKLYSLNKINKRTGAPCVGNAKLSTPSMVTSLAAYMQETHMYIAVGVQKGEIWLHRGTLSRDMSSNFQCNVITTWPITCIAFKRTQKVLHMFACCDGGISMYTLHDGANISLSESKVMLDSAVAPAPCAALLENNKDTYFVVGREDALYCFTIDGRGPCFAIDGVKKHIAAFNHNLVVVLQEDNADTVIIVDTRHKMIMLSKQMPAIMCIMSDKNECYVLTTSGDVYSIRELDADNKLRILCDRNLYTIALRLVEDGEQGDQQKISVANINLKYGDYFLLKGDLDGAVKKYIATLGHIDPYTIIQKLMDSRHTRYLAQYLTALVNTEFADAEHVQLLHNCNERLHLPTKLDALYPNLNYNNNKLEQPSTGFDNWSLLGDGISLGKYLYALENDQNLYKIFAELTETQIYNFFLEHGMFLLQKYPLPTMELLNAICAGDTAIVKEPERFLDFLIFEENLCKEFLEHVTKECVDCNKALNNALFELYLRTWQESVETINSSDLLDFLKMRCNVLNCQHAFILCRLYSFWPGLKYLYNNCLQYQPGAGTQAAKQQTNTQLLIKSLNRQNSETTQSSHLFANLLNEMLDDKQQSLLQILHNLCQNKNILVSHVKEFFSQEHFQKNANQMKKENDVVKQLLQTKEGLQNLLEQYSTNPIEFRSSICDICKQELKPPAKYFLCQHSFHKECLSAYAESEICVACLGTKKQQNILPEQLSMDLETEESSAYGDLVFRGIFNQARSELSKQKQLIEVSKTITPGPINVSNIHISDRNQQWSGRYSINQPKPKLANPFEEDIAQPSKNPFDEYDNNLNPFNE